MGIGQIPLKSRGRMAARCSVLILLVCLTGRCSCGAGVEWFDFDFDLCGRDDDGEPACECPEGYKRRPDGPGELFCCPTQCEKCGDGTVQTTAEEECDDGNHHSGDGCSPQCEVEEYADVPPELWHLTLYEVNGLALDGLGRLYASTSHARIDGSLLSDLYALEAISGEILWHVTAEGASAAPVLDAQDEVYWSTGSGLIALASDGSVRWRTDNPDEAPVSPALGLNGLVFQCHRPEQGSSVAAYDNEDGHLVWELGLTFPTGPCQGILTNAQGIPHVGTGDGVLVVNPINGKLIRRLEAGLTHLEGFGDEGVIVTRDDNWDLTAYGGISDNALWQQSIRNNRAVSNIRTPAFSTVGKSNGILLAEMQYDSRPHGFNYPIRLQAIDALTGNLLRLPGPANLSEMTLVTGIWGEDGLVYHLDPWPVAFDSISGEKRWEFPVTLPSTILPLLGDDGTVYFGADNRVYAVAGGGAGLCQVCPWPKPMHDNRNSNSFGETRPRQLIDLQCVEDRIGLFNAPVPCEGYEEGLCEPLDECVASEAPPTLREWFLQWAPSPGWSAMDYHLCQCADEGEEIGCGWYLRWLSSFSPVDLCLPEPGPCDEAVYNAFADRIWEEARQIMLEMDRTLGPMFAEWVTDPCDPANREAYYAFATQFLESQAYPMPFSESLLTELSGYITEQGLQGCEYLGGTPPTCEEP